MSVAAYVVEPTGLAALQNVVGAISSGAGALAKTAADGWGNCGAASVRGVAAGDCAACLPAASCASPFLVGLDRDASCTGYGGIDFALIYNGTVALIYQAGSLVLNAGAMNPATDLIRVAVESGVVNYRKNGALLYASLVAPTFPLYAVCSLQNQGSSLTGFRIFEAAEVLSGAPAGSVVRI